MSATAWSRPFLTNLSKQCRRCRPAGHFACGYREYYLIFEAQWAAAARMLPGCVRQEFDE
jgi:hypothetical protein